MLETVKSTIRKSFRKKRLDHFPFEKLPANVKIQILQNLSVKNLTNFAATSKDSETFVAENRKMLPRYEFEELFICYDPKLNSVCLRCKSGNRFKKSFLLEAPDIKQYLQCLKIHENVNFQLGTFQDTYQGDAIIKLYQHHTSTSLIDLKLSLSEAKRASEFIFELDNLLPIILENELWTSCAAYRIDSIILIFHEKLYREKAREDYTSFLKRFKSRFTRLPNEKMAHLCRKAQHELEMKHVCKKCNEEDILSVDFFISSDRSYSISSSFSFKKVDLGLF
uniref:F-box domain-containing protein n=1 Tax=Panagrolaimus sp. ES5 TaxID=591445 RepID=A0AC34FNE1_9BILA